ncbi:putative siderophore-binding lipoprotein YfiY [bacterium HR24]|nr:putative siderophore-binding lipoprotein YfiY [bacterium HR24]
MVASPRRWAAGIAALALALIALALAGCGREAPATPTPSGRAAPGVVTDFLGRRVQVPPSPSRVAAVSPTTVELLYYIGGVSVVRTDGASYPPQVADLPSVGPSYSPSLERLASYSPDLVLADSVLQQGLVQRLESLGVPVVMVGIERVEDVPRALRLVGQAIGRPDAGEEAAARLERELEPLRGSVAGRRLRAMALIADAQGNVYAARNDAYVGSVLQFLGAQNVAADLPQTGPFPGFSQVNAEAASDLDPDVVLAISPAPPPAPRLSQLLPRMPGFGSLRAVREGRVVELDPALFLQAPGPRVVEAARQLKQALEGTG